METCEFCKNKITHTDKQKGNYVLAHDIYPCHAKCYSKKSLRNLIMKVAWLAKHGRQSAGEISEGAENEGPA